MGSISNLALHERANRSSTAGGQATPERYYRPELNLVRFLAFFLVFLSHNLPRSPMPGATGVLGSFAPLFYAATNACIFGVSLFFTLSAFLICELLLREKASTGSVAVKEFYVRRIFRIWPLYYVGLTLGVLFALTPHGNRSDLVSMSWYMIFMGAWQAAIHGWLDNPMFVLWSVSVEEQFYLFAPWVVKFISRKSLFAFCIGILLFSNLWVSHLSAAGEAAERIWADSIAQFQCFAAGILLCLILGGRIPRIAIWPRLFLLAGGAACWLCAGYGPMHADFEIPSQPSRWSYSGGYLLASVGSVMILVAFLGISSKLLPKWAVSLGRISFGLYVFHALAKDLVVGALQTISLPKFWMSAITVFASLGVTVLLAKTSYRYLETPFLRLKNRHAVIESQPI